MEMSKKCKKKKKKLTKKTQWSKHMLYQESVKIHSHSRTKKNPFTFFQINNSQK